MKKITLLLLSALSFSACEKEELRDTVANRRIIEINDGEAYIIKSKSHNLPQLEISIGEDYFGIAQLSEDGPGPPPITIERKGDNYTISRTRIEDGTEIIISDDDGDGLADYRMTIPKSSSATIEDISHSFTPRKRKVDAAEQGAAANP